MSGALEKGVAHAHVDPLRRGSDVVHVKVFFFGEKIWDMHDPRPFTRVGGDPNFFFLRVPGRVSLRMQIAFSNNISKTILNPDMHTKGTKTNFTDACVFG